MARKLDGTPVRIGMLIPVSNPAPGKGARPEYYAVRIEDQDGTGEAWCLYTKSELRRFKRVRMKFPIPGMKPGRMYYPHFVGSKWSAILPVVVPENGDRKPPVVAGFCPANDAAERERTILVNMNKTMLRLGTERAAENADGIPGLKAMMDSLD